MRNILVRTIAVAALTSGSLFLTAGGASAAHCVVGDTPGFSYFGNDHVAGESLTPTRASILVTPDAGRLELPRYHREPVAQGTGPFLIRREQALWPGERSDHQQGGLDLSFADHAGQ